MTPGSAWSAPTASFQLRGTRPMTTVGARCPGRRPHQGVRAEIFTKQSPLSQHKTEHPFHRGRHLCIIARVTSPSFALTFEPVRRNTMETTMKPRCRAPPPSHPA